MYSLHRLIPRHSWPFFVLLLVLLLLFFFFSSSFLLLFFFSSSTPCGERYAIRQKLLAIRIKRFFGLLMDTAAKISDFLLPQDEYSSLVRIYPDEFNLMDPIVKINPINNTMDLHAPDEDMGQKQLREASESTAIDQLTHLYQMDRPLWGSLLHNSTPNFVRHATRKRLSGGRSIKQAEKWDSVKALALLSYRVNFYVAIPALANTLTASHPRYIVGAGEGRKFLQTVQPSEPVLAISSTEHIMKKKKKKTLRYDWMVL